MTTEDLIELLKQHPGESVGVAVHLGEGTAFCEVRKVARRSACRPRLLLFVEAELRLDIVSLERAVVSCVAVAGSEGGSEL